MFCVDHWKCGSKFYIIFEVGKFISLEINVWIIFSFAISSEYICTCIITTCDEFCEYTAKMVEPYSNGSLIRMRWTLPSIFVCFQKWLSGHYPSEGMDWGWMRDCGTSVIFREEPFTAFPLCAFVFDCVPLSLRWVCCLVARSYSLMSLTLLACITLTLN